jgi:hypothetical protein
MEDVGDTLNQYWNKINPVTAAQSLATAARHPLDALNSYGKQNSELWQKASDAFKNGEYAEGVRHTLSFFMNGIPGVGAALDSAGDKAGSGDVKGAIADTAALATQLIGARTLPAVTDALTRPGLGGDIAVAAGGAAKGAAKAAVEPINFGRYGVKLPIPAPLASAGAGGLAAHYAGMPEEVGAVIGGATPIVKGAIGGAQEALAARAATARAALSRGVEVPPAPAEPTPLPPSRQLRGAFVPEPPADTSGVIKGWKPTILEREPTPVATPIPPARQIPASSTIIPEAPPDTSGIIKGWKPTILENENAPVHTGVPETATQEVAPKGIGTNPDLLDGLAQGYGYKNFAAIKDSAASKTISDIATKIQLEEELAARRGSTAPVPDAPLPEGYSVNVQPGTDVIDQLPDARMPAPASVQTGASASSPNVSIDRAKSVQPDVAKYLQEGDTRTNPDGSSQTLKRVPVDQIQGDEGNTIYENRVKQYQENGYDVQPELRNNPDGGYVINEGHHRILADVRNGKSDVLAWTPNEAVGVHGGVENTPVTIPGTGLSPEIIDELDARPTPHKSAATVARETQGTGTLAENAEPLTMDPSSPLAKNPKALDLARQLAEEIAKPQIGDTVRLKGVGPVKITKINPEDGTFEYDIEKAAKTGN